MTPTRMITMRRPTTAMTMMLISSDFVERPTFEQHSPGNSRKGCVTIETLNRNGLSMKPYPSSPVFEFKRPQLATLTPSRSLCWLVPSKSHILFFRLTERSFQQHSSVMLSKAVDFKLVCYHSLRVCSDTCASIPRLGTVEESVEVLNARSAVSSHGRSAG